ncbi:hypothetical protein UFOVP435_43 [uncultured Caudovirales phage]|uniref:Uncharacterized protein n=1 Tax=uncultured Caudovirales phage TaxID=2100421 RepID=A0A6J5M9Y7_9CAUD|nr:hypothetical protein UFOVP435_43 [uncultured Caudovirales phage]
MTSATPPKKKPGLRSQKPQASTTKTKPDAFEIIEAELSQLRAEILEAERSGDKETLYRLQLQMQATRDSMDTSGMGSAFGLPLPAVGTTTVLRDPQPLVELSHEALVQEQVAWIRRSGATPVEFLARAYRNPVLEMRDRVAAAKALLDYTHRKLAQQDLPPPKDPVSENYEQSLREKLLDRLRADKAAQG